MANLYRRACLGGEALAELACLGISSVPDSPCTASAVNTCAKSVKELLSSYEVFGSNPADGIAYDAGAYVLFVEERGYKLVLKKALQFVESTVAGLDSTKWQEECSIVLGEKYEPLPAYFMYNKYTEINTSAYLSAWVEASVSWSAVPGTWSAPNMQKEYLYRTGDVYYELSECDDVICLYVVTNDVPINGSVKDNSECLHCANTGFQKCVGYKRKKHPQDAYEVVQIGSRGHYVEVSISLPKPEVLLNERLDAISPNTGKGQC